MRPQKAKPSFQLEFEKKRVRFLGKVGGGFLALFESLFLAVCFLIISFFMVEKGYLPHVEVLDVDVLVRGGLSLAPEQETLLGRGVLDGDILDGEPQNDGPDHTQGHFDVAVADLLGTYRDELDAFVVDKVQGFVDVGDLVEAHLAAVGFGEPLAGDDLEEEHQLEAVSEVCGDVLDAGTGLSQVGVAPCREGLRKTTGVRIII